jgi:hydroxymethylglutaryl-CoA reductase
MALATDGIQRGHMSMHARNLAAEAGAEGNELREVVELMRKDKDYTQGAAAKALKKVRGIA